MLATGAHTALHPLWVPSPCRSGTDFRSFGLSQFFFGLHRRSSGVRKRKKLHSGPFLGWSDTDWPGLGLHFTSRYLRRARKMRLRG